MTCLKDKEQCVFPPRLKRYVVRPSNGQRLIFPCRGRSKTGSSNYKTNPSWSLHDNSIIDRAIIEKLLPTISSNVITPRKLFPGPDPESHENGDKSTTLGNDDCNANTKSQSQPSEDEKELFEPRLSVVLSELIQIFLVSHHPMNPALAQADIESVCNQNTRTPRDQLLLNAVLFVAADYINPVRLVQSGFHGRSDARRKLAQNCMVSYKTKRLPHQPLTLDFRASLSNTELSILLLSYKLSSYYRIAMMC